MKQQAGSILRNLMLRGLRRSLSRAVADASAMPLSVLRSRYEEYRRLKRPIDQFAHIAEHRLALPLIGSTAIQVPIGTDWSWRPEAWRGPISPKGQASVENKTEIGRGLTVFHDCRATELTYRQLRNRRASDLAPFGMRLDVFRFDGSFLSLVLDLPKESVSDLRRHHVIRLDAIVEMEKPLEIYARLNVRHGPNTEQIVRELPLSENQVMVEFDLAYTRLKEKRAERIWVDLVFEGPEMNQITLRDVTFARHPRAQL